MDIKDDVSSNSTVDSKIKISMEIGPYTPNELLFSRGLNSMTRIKSTVETSICNKNQHNNKSFIK
jgi:hypothetical protein